MGKNNLERIKTLMRINENADKMPKPELLSVKKGADKKYYGIVKEGNKYYIKKAQITAKTKNFQNLVESDFIYVGGVQNKSDFCYESLTRAEKNLAIKLKGLNEAYQGIYEADEEEDVAEEPKAEAKPKPEPEMDDAEGDDLDSGVDMDLKKQPKPEMGAESEPQEDMDAEGVGNEEMPEDAESDFVDAGEGEPESEIEGGEDSDVSPESVQGHISQKMAELLNSPIQITGDHVKSLINAILNPLEDKDLLSLLDEEDAVEISEKIKPQEGEQVMQQPQQSESLKRKKSALLREMEINEGIKKLLAENPTLQNRVNRLQEKKKRLDEKRMVKTQKQKTNKPSKPTKPEQPKKQFPKPKINEERELRKVINETVRQELAKLKGKK